MPNPEVEDYFLKLDSHSPQPATDKFIFRKNDEKIIKLCHRDDLGTYILRLPGGAQINVKASILTVIPK